MTLKQREEEEDPIGLSYLGINPCTGRHALLKLSLRNQNLRTLVLPSFNLTSVDVSHNNLTTLSALSSLPALLHLNASHNSLTSVLDYKVPICQKSSSWPSGETFIGSTVTSVNLSFNTQISEIPFDLSHSHRRVRTLLLNHTSISSLSGRLRYNTLTHLSYLSIAHSNLVSTRGLAPLTGLETLVLHHNRIVALSDLSQLPRLCSVDLRHNAVSGLSGLEDCTSLQVLELSDNPIVYAEELKYLADLQMLSSLSLSGCPISKTTYYKPSVLVRLDRITVLDGKVVSAKERVKASSVYYGNDVESRREVFYKHMPDETAMFVNMIPPLCLDDDTDDNNALGGKKVHHHLLHPVEGTAINVSRMAILVGSTKFTSQRLVDQVLGHMKHKRRYLF